MLHDAAGMDYDMIGRQNAHFANRIADGLLLLGADGIACPQLHEMMFDQVPSLSNFNSTASLKGTLSKMFPSGSAMSILPDRSSWPWRTSSLSSERTPSIAAARAASRFG